MTADEIIQLLGGDSAVSAETGTPVSTVNSWRRNDSIPAWRRPALLALALRLQKPLAATDFPPTKARKQAA